ncbi:MAG: hypothetical protein DYH13_07680 [Alphaproteobacteria bacterium PRO2]|nr:hypothetical protein [Alphaproteobacteria bacterium PRO2]
MIATHEPNNLLWSWQYRRVFYSSHIQLQNFLYRATALFQFLAQTYKVILIFDEIITGFRVDLGGAQKLYGVIRLSNPPQNSGVLSSIR